jgi:hypothetical protein
MSYTETPAQAAAFAKLVGTREEVFNGVAYWTSTHIKQDEIVKTGTGAFVVKGQMEALQSWNKAVTTARRILHVPADRGRAVRRRTALWRAATWLADHPDDETGANDAATDAGVFYSHYPHLMTCRYDQPQYGYNGMGLYGPQPKPENWDVPNPNLENEVPSSSSTHP